MSTIHSPSTSSPCVNNEHCSLTFEHTVWASKVDILKEAECWLHVRGTFDDCLGFDTLSANLHHFTWQVKKKSSVIRSDFFNWCDIYNMVKVFMEAGQIITVTSQIHG